MSLPMNIVKFANGNESVLKVYNQMRDYYCHYMSAHGKKIGDFDQTISLNEKEDKMHEALLSEIGRISGQKISDDIPLEAWAMNPMVKWATFAVVGMMIDAIIPDTIIKSVGLWSEIKTVGYGETLEVEIAPNSLFNVSESGNAKRFSFNNKDYRVTKTLSAVNHQITVEVSLYRVLAGKENLAEFVRKAIMSMDRQMTVDNYNALNALVNNAKFPSDLTVNGYDAKELLHLCEAVEAYNNGAGVTILGTQSALYNVLPDSAKGYRITTDSANMGIHLIRDFFDYDIMVLPQVATGERYGLRMDDAKLYILSTGADKLIKGVIEGNTMSYTDNNYDNADLTQHTTLNKRWGFAVCSNATAGVVKLA